MTNSSDRDVERIRSVYRPREREGEFWDFRTFHTLEPQIYFNESEFRDHLFDVLRRDGYDFHRADQAVVFEIGCGWGRNLNVLLDAGFRSANLRGVDLMEHFIDRGRALNPALPIAVGNGAHTRVPAGSVDIVLCHTVMSAILDEGLHRQIVDEAIRILKPGGLLIVFDILPGYPSSFARTEDGREVPFIRPVAPEVVIAAAAGRARRTYYRTMGLRQPLRAATFYGWWNAVARKLRLQRAFGPPRPYAARALVARLLGIVPALRTHFLLVLTKSPRAPQAAPPDRA